LPLLVNHIEMSSIPHTGVSAVEIAVSFLQRMAPSPATHPSEVSRDECRIARMLQVMCSSDDGQGESANFLKIMSRGGSGWCDDAEVSSSPFPPAEQPKCEWREYATNCQRIDESGGDVSDDEVVALAQKIQARSFRCIQELVLVSFVSIAYRVLVWFKHLDVCALQRNNRVGEKGAVALAEVLKSNSSIQILNLVSSFSHPFLVLCVQATFPVLTVARRATTAWATPGLSRWVRD
jgi:hypothetical protein